MKVEVITTPDPRLREVSEKVRAVTPEVREIIAQMRQACTEWEAEHPHELSAAIAAPQLGVNQRIILVREDFDHKENNSFMALINPEILKTEGKITRDYEGCLSVPEIYGLVPRPHKARIKATLEDGQEVRVKADGFLARTLLHEIDHLDGILFIDHIKGSRKAFFRMNNKGDLEPVDYDAEIKDNKELWPDD